VREFGQLESAVMDVIWGENRPCVVREVRERLRYDRPLAYTTVMTVLTILHGKGVLRREKYGRAWRYWPAERREEHDARLMAEILRSGGDSRVTLRSFLDRMSDEDLTAIRNVVELPPVVHRAAVG
jgi:predicted transcriptional regulator